MQHQPPLHKMHSSISNPTVPSSGNRGGLQVDAIQMQMNMMQQQMLLLQQQQQMMQMSGNTANIGALTQQMQQIQQMQVNLQN